MPKLMIDAGTVLSIGGVPIKSESAVLVSCDRDQADAILTHLYGTTTPISESPTAPTPEAPLETVPKDPVVVEQPIADTEPEYDAPVDAVQEPEPEPEPVPDAGPVDAEEMP